jgi:hypothetical protein
MVGTISGLSFKVPVLVTMQDGTVWKFNYDGDGATVAGVAVSPNALKVGMKCKLFGSSAPIKNIIISLACE